MTDDLALDPNGRLREIMDSYRITRRGISSLVGVSQSAVDAWLCPEDSRNFRPMPERSLRLLELELGIAAPRLWRFIGERDS